MSVRYWANQHGAGVVLDGEHLDTILRAAKERGCTPEEALNQILLEHAQQVLKTKKSRPCGAARK